MGEMALKDELTGWAFLLVFVVLYFGAILVIPTFLGLIGAP